MQNLDAFISELALESEPKPKLEIRWSLVFATIDVRIRLITASLVKKIDDASKTYLALAPHFDGLKTSLSHGPFPHV
jgi:hypothetical protein